MSQYYPRDGQPSNPPMNVSERRGAPIASTTAYAYPPANAQHRPETIPLVQQERDPYRTYPGAPNRRTTDDTRELYTPSSSRVYELDDKSTSNLSPSDGPYHQNLPSTPYLDRAPQPPGSDPDQRLVKSYSTNLIIAFLWVILVAGLVGLLEATVSTAKTAAKQPWYFDWLPTVALTVFTQAHGPITAAFHARIAVSALKTRWAPKTWAELFYTADGKYGSPLGVLTSLWSTGGKVSLVFWLFIVHTVLAIAAPLLLARAYPVQAISVAVAEHNMLLNTFYSPNMENVEFPLQVAIGGGGLATGLSVLEVFNSSAYVPRESLKQGTPSEMFFAGDSKLTDTVLEGLHIQGSCERVLGLADPIGTEDFVAMCGALPQPLGSNQAIFAGFVDNNQDSTHVNTSACGSRPPYNTWMDNATSSFTTGYMWINAYNSTNASEGTTVSGVAMCNATFTTARAAVYGLSGTFDSLEPIAVYNDTLGNQVGNVLGHPLTAAMYTLQNPPGTALNGPVAVLDMWGYTPYNSDSLGPNYDQPTIDDMISQIWAGALYMTSSIAMASQKAEQPHDAVAYFLVSGRVREGMWAVAAWAVLILWFMLIILLGVLLFRPAIGDSMSSYEAGRLLAERPELVRGKEYGTLGDNEYMKRPFS
ncbi:hypothetical protein FIBSPDRAFT_1040677 [Athelia psychrophila]|uniref:Uncharacterized protein n=1 Tax=Athelia psychrophila TaxID=1759441 RepID=A0A166Q0W3_9AGAM|nr:hypothetical protein FIBSPDRAFT_1040677 [Fibularhizoctonia sp. CBS 109695]